MEDEMSVAERSAWLRLERAEVELEAARRNVIEVTNKETRARQAASLGLAKAAGLE